MAGRTRTQARSAAEMQIKRDMLSVRPDDMANAVDRWMSAVAKLEISGAASLEDEDDIARVSMSHDHLRFALSLNSKSCQALFRQKPSK